MNANNKKVYVGLSGGVDSSVSAALLKEQGFEVTGVFIKVWQPTNEQGEALFECTWKEDRLDAMRVCATLDIPFITLDLEREYKQEVVDYMISEYKAGRVPNPDVMCNREVKFGAFFKWAMEQGADYVATGHYAQVKEGYELVRGKDDNKDQTYFLWTLTQKQLQHTLFPIGHIEKSKVRALAEKHNLITATKKDSQGLCFMGQIDMKKFLKEYIDITIGNVADEKGAVIGEHDGVAFYTLGARHGFRITTKGTDDLPYYVVKKRVEDNVLVVSHKTPGEDKADGVVTLTKLSWTGNVPQKGKEYTVQLRYRGNVMRATIITLSGDSLELSVLGLSEAVISGQSAVLYDGDVCLGGGIIA